MTDERTMRRTVLARWEDHSANRRSEQLEGHRAADEIRGVPNHAILLLTVHRRVNGKLHTLDHAERLANPIFL